MTAATNSTGDEYTPGAQMAQYSEAAVWATTLATMIAPGPAQDRPTPFPTAPQHPVTAHTPHGRAAAANRRSAISIAT